MCRGTSFLVANMINAPPPPPYKLPYERSFASHPKAQYWSERNDFSPREVAMYCHKKFWFNCHKCGHELNMKLNNVSNGNWCAYCANQKLCNDNNCDFCFNKSFASHPKAQYWSERNDFLPCEVAMHCNEKFWFDCIQCGHELNMK